MPLSDKKKIKKRKAAMKARVAGFIPSHKKERYKELNKKRKVNPVPHGVFRKPGKKGLRGYA